MKKFTALLCTMAMVLSLFAFSGVALAATTLSTTIDSDTIVAVLPTDSGFASSTFNLSGTVTAGGRAPNALVDVKLYTLASYDEVTETWAGAPVVAYTTSTYSGKFEFGLPNTVTLGTQYWLRAEGVGFGNSSVKKVTVGYKVSMDSEPSDLSYLDKDLKYVSGKVVDAKGNAVANTPVRVVYDDEAGPAPAGTTAMNTSPSGRFDLGVGQIKVAKLKIEANYGGGFTTLKSYTVSPIEFDDLDKGSTSVKSTIAPVTIGGDAADLTAPDGSSFDYTTDLDDVVLTVTGPQMVVGVAAPTDEVEIDWNDLITFTSTGTADVEVNWKDKLVSTYSITVGNPATVNVEGPDSYSVGKTDRVFTIRLADGAAPTRVVAELNAPGLEDAIEIDSSSPDAAVFTYAAGVLTLKDVTLEQAGELTLEVTAYDGATKKGTANFSAPVKGLRVESSVTEVAVDSTNTFTVTITNADGTAINNANVYLLNTDAANTEAGNLAANIITSVKSTKTNITGGVYTFTDKKFSTIADLTLAVYQDGALKAEFKNYFEVKGVETFTLEVDKASILAGVSSDLAVVVKNAAGEIVPVDRIVAKVDDAAWATKDETWNSSKKYTFSATPTKSLEIRAENNDKKEIGSLVINVVKPELQFSRENITDGVKQTYTVKIVNPITGEAMNGVLDFTTEGLEAAPTIQDADSNTITLNSQPRASEYTFKILADAKAAADLDADEVPSFTFKVTPETGVLVKDVATVKVLPATLTSDKASVVIGAANDIVLTLADANGAGLSSKTVKLNGTEVGKTGTDGKLATSVYAIGASTFTFTYTNDAAEDVKTTVNAVRDTQAPAVTLDTVGAQTKAEYVTIKGVATDNVEVKDIYVGNNIAVGIPGANGMEFSYDVALKVGANTINVVVVDATGNRTAATVTVTRVLPTVVKMTLGTTDVTKDGQALTGLDVPAQSIGGRTMLPLRFAFETLLGGTVDYNNGVITVTYNGKTAVMTVGSTTAMVDGQAMTLLSAPVVQNNRALAPIREVLQAFGVTVGFDSATNSVTLTY